MAEGTSALKLDGSASCAVLNAGHGAWAFEELAVRLAGLLGVEVCATPADFNYLLGWDDPKPPAGGELFIPYAAILTASDKRLQADVFSRNEVATPRTYLLGTHEEVRSLLRREAERQWVLKYPTGCGGAGHRVLAPDVPLPADWPRPFVVQELVPLETPEVYRLYCAAGETFGWNVRRFPPGARPSLWVAHARGARYEAAGPAPEEAEHQARKALEAAGLAGSFGCVDLLPHSSGRWLVLEVGTDGVFNHVDREVDLPGFRDELDRRLRDAFWSRAETVAATFPEKDG